jgi:hypothetical protein
MSSTPAIYDTLKQAALRSATPVPELLKLHQQLEGQRQEIYGFLTRRDALLVHHACAGIGKDDELLIQVICNRTKKQLKDIDLYYRSMPLNSSHKTLSEKLSSELGGDYARFIKYLVESRGQFMGKRLYRSLFQVKVIYILP